MNDWGVSGTSNFGFWPMLFGGLFLYMAYYGCDQSQAQRLLAARSDKDVQKILVLNGLMRFPLVLAYCLLGLGLAAYALERPEFLGDLPVTASGTPNLNLVFPAFVQREFAPGLAGLAIVGLFAAAMSSIDSALNSLSASTLEDFLPAPKSASQRGRFIQSKLVTLCWGVFAVAFSFSVEHIASTLLESINKVGSLVNGPLLGLFTIAILLPGTGPRIAVSAFITGAAANLALWQLAPNVSWLWWNVAGCLVTLFIAIIGSSSAAIPGALKILRDADPPRSTHIALLGGFAGILALLLITQSYMQSVH